MQSFTVRQKEKKKLNNNEKQSNEIGVLGFVT